MNRRAFLRRGVIGGALLALAGAGLAAWPTHRSHAPSEERAFLSERAFQILCAVVGRVVPQAPDVRPIAHGIDRSLVDLSAEGRVDLERLLLLFDNALAGLLFDGRARPFTALEAAEQDRVLEAWRDSRVVLRRGGYQVLRRLAVSAYYAGPDAQRATGYFGPRRVPGLSYEDSTAGVKP